MKWKAKGGRMLQVFYKVRKARLVLSMYQEEVEKRRCIQEISKQLPEEEYIFNWGKQNSAKMCCVLTSVNGSRWVGVI